jgi:hypothetical protein
MSSFAKDKPEPKPATDSAEKPDPSIQPPPYRIVTEGWKPAHTQEKDDPKCDKGKAK